MATYYAEQKLENRSGYQIEVIEDTFDKSVKVLASGKEVFTTVHYLDGFYRPLGEARS